MKVLLKWKLSSLSKDDLKKIVIANIREKIRKLSFLLFYKIEMMKNIGKKPRKWSILNFGSRMVQFKVWILIKMMTWGDFKWLWNLFMWWCRELFLYIKCILSLWVHSITLVKVNYGFVVYTTGGRTWCDFARGYKKWGTALERDITNSIRVIHWIIA